MPTMMHIIDSQDSGAHLDVGGEISLNIMLTKEQIEIVKSTVPILKVHGEAITTTFYRNLFEENPQLKNIFNMANQAKGDQARSLAASVLAYASNIDQLQNLGPAVSLIAHKHCSLDVLPEHYPIVGRNLIRAIGEVLGDAVTPAIAEAWTAAYNQLAEILIGVEAKLYADNAERGWTGFKPFTVTSKQRESYVITSFVLTPRDGEPLPEHKVGQFLSLKLKGVGQHEEIRQYTISNTPRGDAYRVSVKREEGGQVSNHLHDSLNQGDIVLVHMPQGDFVLDEEATGPVALISGGVGITPTLAMLERLADQASEREVIFVHCAMSSAVHAFKDRVEELCSTRPNFSQYVAYEAPSSKDSLGTDYQVEGQITLEALQSWVPKNADCYFCGPKGFMKAVEKHLEEIGIPADKRKSEVFGPTLDIEEVAAV